MFLDLDLLELDKLGATRLQVQSTACLVHSTIVRWTISDRHKGQSVDGLIGFSATSIASVSGHNHHRLDLRASCHDSSDRHQFANILSLDITNRNGFGGRLSLEVDFTIGGNKYINQFL